VPEEDEGPANTSAGQVNNSSLMHASDSVRFCFFPSFGVALQRLCHLRGLLKIVLPLFAAVRYCSSVPGWQRSSSGDGPRV
jgi:hypothetical protein